MSTIRKSRTAGFIVITLVYILAATAGIIIYASLPFDIWLKLLIADVISTIIVFIFSCIFSNASVYDPYWSVQPPVILTAFAFAGSMNFVRWLMLAAVWLWAIRLTGNWAYTFHGLEHQDWRYTMLKVKTGMFYPVINFLGIHMFPTLVVYACVLPAVYVFNEEVTLTASGAVFFLLCLMAVLLELIADSQMRTFRKSSSGLINAGLWKYARHPNYLGEILMWWGVGFQAVCALGGKWWLLAGALINTLMFIIVSIPMADKRQSAKPGYDEYMKRTHALFPFKRSGH